MEAGMNKTQMENRYLEAFMDRDTSKVFSAEASYHLIEKRAELKVAIKKSQSTEEKIKLQKEYDLITEKINNPNSD